MGEIMTYAIVSIVVVAIAVLLAGVIAFQWTRKIRDGVGASLLTFVGTLPFLLWYLGVL